MNALIMNTVLPALAADTFSSPSYWTGHVVTLAYIVAAILFIVKGLVDWRLAALMAAGSIAGGYAGAGTAQRIGQKNVRRIVILIGFCLTISLLLRRWGDALASLLGIS